MSVPTTKATSTEMGSTYTGYPDQALTQYTATDYQKLRDTSVATTTLTVYVWNANLRKYELKPVEFFFLAPATGQTAAVAKDNVLKSATEEIKAKEKPKEEDPGTPTSLAKELIRDETTKKITSFTQGQSKDDKEKSEKVQNELERRLYTAKAFEKKNNMEGALTQISGLEFSYPDNIEVLFLKAKYLMKSPESDRNTKKQIAIRLLEQALKLCEREGSKSVVPQLEILKLIEEVKRKSYRDLFP